MQYELPISAVPNQFFTTSLNGETWEVTLETRFNNLYISLSNKNDGLILANRICLDKTLIGHGFFFYDIEGNSDPTYDMLGIRYFLIWDSEL